MEKGGKERTFPKKKSYWKFLLRKKIETIQKSTTGGHVLCNLYLAIHE